MHRALPLALLVVFTAGPSPGAELSPQAVELRNRGVAELENEAPVRAEATFRELLRLAPSDPLPHANLAIALLRQQRFEDARDSIGKALARVPDDPELLAIAAEIEHWSGNSGEALMTFRRAAEAAPDAPLIQYSLYRQATSTSDPAAEAAAALALERLAKLRPENLVVLLQRAKLARESGDRAGATAAYLRIRELIWQAPPGADRLLDQILDGLEAGELEGLRSAALRLENVLKISPMHREGLRELSSGIQGVPLTRFREEPPIRSWGRPTAVVFRASTVDQQSTAASALAAGDLDGDETPEVVRIVTGESTRLEVWRVRAEQSRLDTVPVSADSRRVLLADLDNDGRQEVLLLGRSGTGVFTLAAEGRLQSVSDTFGLAAVGGSAAAVIDFDIEGDLDLLLAGEQLSLMRNSLTGPLENVAAKSLPQVNLPPIDDALASDLDRDGDLDLLLAHREGLAWLDNLRQGRFSNRSRELPATGPSLRVVSADLNNDGWPDLVAAGPDIRLFRGSEGGFVPWSIGGLQAIREVAAVAVLDADNDGRLDLALASNDGLAVLAQRDGSFEPLPIEGGPLDISALAVADVDGDGDLDLLTDGGQGFHLVTNHGGNRNRFLSVRLRGLNKGNSKNNIFGLGSSLEVKAGAAYQFREAVGETVHFGLGSVAAPDLLRVVWTNGVPQNRLQPEANQRIVEEQQLKGSCPFLYAKQGGQFRFVTDLLWGAPIGLPVAEGLYMGADPQELVLVEGAESDEDRYELRITEELWEAAFFDRLRLWIVDHEEGVEVASSLRIQPGATVDERVHGSRAVRPVLAAWDAVGREVSARVARRDEIYADGWQRSAYQGVASEPWAFTFDLGDAPGRSIRLLLDGWIFPTDASLNLALAQRRSPAPEPPRLEVKTRQGWQTLIPSMGFPAGKTKTMVIDTPPLPVGSSSLRIVSGQWLSWDRIAWTDTPADQEPQIRTRLEPARAELRYRGFSALVRRAPNAPHTFDYARVTTTSPWLPFPGRYTRYGDVRELLLEADDRSVILGPGDELAVTFDAGHLPPPAPGTRRSVFLESHGWDKDADRNTGEGRQVDPLPFRAMSRYPYPADESFPDSAAHRRYLERWLTRVVEPQRVGSMIAAP